MADSEAGCGFKDTGSVSMVLHSVKRPHEDPGLSPLGLPVGTAGPCLGRRSLGDRALSFLWNDVNEDIHWKRVLRPQDLGPIQVEEVEGKGALLYPEPLPGPHGVLV